MRRFALALAFLGLLPAATAAAAPPIVAFDRGAAAPGAVVRAGDARIQVLSPTLLRLEYAEDGRFEDRPTQTVIARRQPVPRFTARTRKGVLTIRTKALTLRYRVAGGRFRAGTLTLTLGNRRIFHPDTVRQPQPLGGWRRSLDLEQGPVGLHPGVLTREGWRVVDDTATALLTAGEPGFETRPKHDGAYQDLYLFAPGDRPLKALRDLKAVGGAAPLLPRKAFGVWFSRYWPYSDPDFRGIVDRFRAEGVPLDTLSLDTDWKKPHEQVGSTIESTLAGAEGTQGSWNAWDWNTKLFPDPAAFLRYAHDNGIQVGLNIHPSINSNDAHFAETQQAAGGALQPSDTCRVLQADPTGTCHVFDWTDPKQLGAYFALHTPFEQQGADFWWLDWCCDGSRADAPGLTPDTFINWRYAERQRARGSRWPAFQRMGGSYQLGFGGDGGLGALAERRQTIQFTGDTCGTWEMLAFEPAFTAAAGAIGMPYVSHDIGSFHSTPPNGVCDGTVSPVTSSRTNSLSGELYVRWVQLGVVQPLLRLHSQHGKRLPWEYPAPYDRAAADALRQRGALVPYLYTAAARARATGAPMTRALWLDWPRRDEAYRHDGEYLLGDDLLVAPVTVPGSPARVSIWFPPGGWTDIATGQRFRGPRTASLDVPLDRIPMFARDGALIPQQGATDLLLTAYPGSGMSRLYDDAGDGLAYLERGGSATVRLAQRRTKRKIAVTIGAERAFAGRPATRSWTLAVRGVARDPRRVLVNGKPAPASPLSGDGTLTVRLSDRPTGRPSRVVVKLR